MPRRGRRSAMGFIENDKERRLTYSRRRDGIFKAASDLSTLTGARVAVVLESEDGKFSAFGAPELGPILDAFLSEDLPTQVDTGEKHKATNNLKDELFHSEKENAVEVESQQESMPQTTQVLDTSSMAYKYVYGNIKDLSISEIHDMYQKLSQIKEEINELLSTHYKNA